MSSTPIRFDVNRTPFASPISAYFHTKNTIYFHTKNIIFLKIFSLRASIQECAWFWSPLPLGSESLTSEMFTLLHLFRNDLPIPLCPLHRLVGLVVPQEHKIPGSNPVCAGNFSGSSHTSDLKIGTPVATLPGAWRYSISAGTGRPGVSILWLGEMDSWICNFYLSVAARKIVWADPSLRYTRMLLGC